MTPAEQLAVLDRTAPVLAAKLRKLPPQQLNQLLTKERK